MEYRELGSTGITVSPVGFGVLTVGRTQLNKSIEESAELIRFALDLGINFFDTAQYYRTYPHLRAALQGRTEEPILASKSLDPTAAGMNEAIEEARRELDRDVIDIFMLHEVRAGSDFEMRRGAWEALRHAKEKGLVRAIGISTHHVDVAESMIHVPECDLVFPLINRAGLGIRRGDAPGTPEEMAAAIAALSDAGKGIFAMKVFGGGNLTGTYLECLDYVTALPGIDSTMIGFGSRREVQNAVDYFEGRLPAGFQPNISNKKIRIDQGDCEGCGACIARCPNHAIFRNQNGLAQVDHTLCLTCGYCAPVCPVRAILMF